MDDDGVTVAEFPKNSRELLRVRLTRYQGRPLVDVRSWYLDGTGERRPGKGIALDRAKIPDLIDALQAANRADDAEAPTTNRDDTAVGGEAAKGRRRKT